MEYDCVLGLFALRCKYLKQFDYSCFPHNISPEVAFATYIRNSATTHGLKLRICKNLDLWCCFAGDLSQLDV